MHVELLGISHIFTWFSGRLWFQILWGQCHPGFLEDTLYHPSCWLPTPYDLWIFLREQAWRREVQVPGVAHHGTALPPSLNRHPLILAAAHWPAQLDQPGNWFGDFAKEALDKKALRGSYHNERRELLGSWQMPAVKNPKRRARRIIKRSSVWFKCRKSRLFSTLCTKHLSILQDQIRNASSDQIINAL